MKIFYINLQERTDRKEYMEKMLTDLNLKYERFDAVRVSPEIIKSKYKTFYDNCVPRFKKYINSKNEGVIKRGVGAFGCYMSHFKIHKIMEQENAGPYMILEDDVIITQSTLDELYLIVNKLKDDWDMIRSTWGCTDKLIKIKGVNFESRFTKDSSIVHREYGGTHFTLFNNPKRIIDYLSSENLFSIDAVYYTDHLNVYRKKLNVGIYPFESSIPKHEET